MKKIILFIGLLLFSQNYLAQEMTATYNRRSEIKDNTFKKDINKPPQFDINVGIGRVSGLRLGGRILFSKHFSFETAYGASITRILTISSNQTVLSLGLNLHFLDKKNVTISFIAAFINGNFHKFKLAYLSPTFGVMILNKKGSHFFIRIGPFVESLSSGFFGKKGTYGVNIDLGYNFVF